MKTLGKIKLNQFSKNELDQRKLNALKGGCDCRYSGCITCACLPTWEVSYDKSDMYDRQNTYVSAY